MKADPWKFRLPWQCSGTTQGASPDRARLGLHWKPLDASIGQVPEPYKPGGRHGQQFVETTQNTNKAQLLASNYGKFRGLFVRISYHKTDPLLSSSMRQAVFLVTTHDAFK